MSEETTLSELERNLAIALHNGDKDKCVAALRRSPLVIPITDAMHEGREPVEWPTIRTADGRIAVPTFTSVELMREATQGGATYGQQTSMAHLASGWPDNTWLLWVNPRTPLHFEFEAGYFGRLVCPDLEYEKHANPEFPVPVVQKALRIDEVVPLIGAPAARVSGYVQKSVDVARFKVPTAMLGASGIHDQEPYLTADGSVYFLRWFALGNDLYRVPIGGRDTEQCAATAGWVIEEAPFVGLGMAPHPNSMVAEYRVNGVLLPDGAELGILDSTGDYRRRAVFSGDLDRWLMIQRGDEMDEVPAELHEAWEAKRASILQSLEDE